MKKGQKKKRKSNAVEREEGKEESKVKEEALFGFYAFQERGLIFLLIYGPICILYLREGYFGEII